MKKKKKIKFTDLTIMCVTNILCRIGYHSYKDNLIFFRVLLFLNFIFMISYCVLPKFYQREKYLEIYFYVHNFISKTPSIYILSITPMFLVSHVTYTCI